MMYFGSITSQRPIRPLKLRSGALGGSSSPWKASIPQPQTTRKIPGAISGFTSPAPIRPGCLLLLRHGVPIRERLQGRECPKLPPKLHKLGCIPRPSTSITTLPHTLPDSAILRHDFMHHWLLHFPNWPISFLVPTI